MCLTNTFDRSSFEKTGIYNLANEIHAIIFEQFNNFYDVYALCLTNTYFWIVGIPRLRVLFVQEGLKKQNLWAGDRLICLGKYAETLPEGLLTEDEEEELSTMPIPDGCWEIFEEMRQWTQHIPDKNRCDDRHCDEMKRIIKWDSDLERSRQRYPGVEDWRSPYQANLEWEIKEGGPYVLRNLTKKALRAHGRVRAEP